MEGLSLDPRNIYRHVKSRTPETIRSDSSFRDILDGTGKKSSAAVSAIRREELKKACTAMEALFVDQVLNAMRKNVKKDFLNGGFAEEVFEDMLYNEYSQKMAESGKFGIAEIMYEQLKDSV